MPDSELFEAADLLEQIGNLLKDNPEELVNIASGTEFQRHASAYYFQHLADVLRKEGNNATKDGQG